MNFGSSIFVFHFWTWDAVPARGPTWEIPGFWMLPGHAIFHSEWWRWSYQSKRDWNSRAKIRSAGSWLWVWRAVQNRKLHHFALPACDSSLLVLLPASGASHERQETIWKARHIFQYFQYFQRYVLLVWRLLRGFRAKASFESKRQGQEDGLAEPFLGFSCFFWGPKSVLPVMIVMTGGHATGIKTNILWCRCLTRFWLQIMKPGI